MALRPVTEKSFVDSLFDMPEAMTKERKAIARKAESGLLEARLAAEMRALIAARLRGDESA